MSQITPELEGKVINLIHQGNKLEAIKLVKDNTKLGLKESKDYVDSVESMPKKPLPIHSELPNKDIDSVNSTPNLESEVIKLIKANQMLHAIKLVVDNTNLGLKGSKEYVDTLKAKL